MASIYDTLRGRSRTQTAGVSDVMVRLKDMVIAKAPPALTVPSSPRWGTNVPKLGITVQVDFINPMSVLELTPGWNYPDTGILSWNNGSTYKTSNLMESFRQRYSKSFALTNRRLTYLG